MTEVTLDNITDSKKIEILLGNTIHEYLGINGKTGCNLIASTNGFGWTLGEYLFEIANQISSKAYQKGFELGNREFKNFDPDKTKLNNKIKEELWLTISKFIRDKVYDAYDSSSFEIPGLSEAIEQGPISFGIYSNPDRKAAREALVLNLGKINDLEAFYLRAKNNLFNRWKERYGLFNGAKGDN
ncbi:MAG: hypothetical protein PHH54_06185 [Candidatus Nanoarchaeia archaeon]|nr:hypothetical protein [Candidatus Nanoarchaeia archaeon]MDD5741543.1 hypothetical protein [Candidatus Nanoarchaeia archaeon]